MTFMFPETLSFPSVSLSYTFPLSTYLSLTLKSKTGLLKSYLAYEFLRDDVKNQILIQQVQGKAWMSAVHTPVLGHILKSEALICVLGAPSVEWPWVDYLLFIYLSLFICIIIYLKHLQLGLHEIMYIKHLAACPAHRKHSIMDSFSYFYFILSPTYLLLYRQFFFSHLLKRAAKQERVLNVCGWGIPITVGRNWEASVNQIIPKQ